MEFWADLEGVALSDEADQPVWIQALPLNKYTHPVHGTIDITAERAKRFADNVKNKVRGQDLDIDYDHKKRTDEAAGWVVDAEAKLNEADPKKNGLWIAVNFTKDALTKLKNKSYRYFSSEFQDKWKHPSTNQEYADVLFGGALTNRPFLKDILPINLSEIADDVQPKEGTVDIEKLRKQLNLPETATEDEVLTAVADLQKGESKDDTKNASKEEGKESETESASLSEGEEKLKQLAETDPIIKFLLDDREATQKKLSALEQKQVKNDIQTKLSDLTKDAKFKLPPAVIEEATRLSEDSSLTTAQLSDKMFDILGTIAKTGVVELGERGAAHEIELDSQKRLSDEISKFQKENPEADYATALSEVTRRDPSLYDNYLTELTEV